MQFSCPEHQLLAYAARLSLDAATGEQLRVLLRSNIDWDHLYALADRHNVLPILHHHLGQLESEVPSMFMAQVREEIKAHTRRTTLLTAELLRLVELLESHDVPVIPFKGPTLARLAYGEISLRDFADLDLFIRADDFPKVKAVLTERGFHPEADLTSQQERALLRFESAQNFSRDHTVVFDVHWKFAARYFSYKFPVNEMLKRLQTVKLAGRSIRTLSNEDLLTVLCIHGATHCWARLGWIADVAALLSSKPELNWQQLMQDVTAAGNRRTVLLGLMLASKLLAAPLPAQVLAQLQSDAIVGKLSEEIIQRLWQEDHVPLLLKDEMNFQLSLRDGRLDRLRYRFNLAVTPRTRDWMSLNVPTSLWVLHYCWRPIRLAGKYGTQILTGPTQARRPPKLSLH